MRLERTLNASDLAESLFEHNWDDGRIQGRLGDVDDDDGAQLQSPGQLLHIVWGGHVEVGRLVLFVRVEGVDPLLRNVVRIDEERDPLDVPQGHCAPDAVVVPGQVRHDPGSLHFAHFRL